MCNVAILLLLAVSVAHGSEQGLIALNSEEAANSWGQIDNEAAANINKTRAATLLTLSDHDGMDFKNSHLCYQTFVMTSKDDKNEPCPRACPFYVQNKLDDKVCSFMCIAGQDCTKYNPKTAVADPVMGICRAPMVSNCKEYEHGVDQDKCHTCEDWYYLRKKDGKCYSEYVILLAVVASILGVIVLLLMAWAVDIGLRPVTNPRGLSKGMKFRESQKLHEPKVLGQALRLWPLTTNLCRTLVAGPGMTLHFNFQGVIIGWALLIAIGWTVMGFTIDGALFILGTRDFATPRQNCILVAWGYETQQRLMWTKVGFCYWVYVGTFACCLIHSVRQLRIFQDVDFKNKTMKDFAALVQGLPDLSGSDRVEDNLKETIQRATGQSMVGISIAWDYNEDQEIVQEGVESELRMQEGILSPTTAEAGGAAGGLRGDENFGPVRKALFNKEVQLFAEDDERTEDLDAQLEARLKAMTTSPEAFAVFETEEMKDRAVEYSEQNNGIPLGGSRITLSQITCEPDTVYWQNFGHTSSFLQVLRVVRGFGYIFLALLVWTLVFYAPYAWSVFSFNYDNGQQPGAIYGIVFSMVVVIGNAMMYEVCARVSDAVQYRFKDSRETTYMLLYTIACSFNIILDFVTTYFTTWEIIKGLHFRTYHGAPIQEIGSFTDRFESYAMQRVLAENTYRYAFPSTYLIPFILEPIITIAVPLKIGQIIVRTHPEVQGKLAEELLAAPAMEMGRYADLILNLILGVMIFWFPGGWTHSLFFGLAVSHIYIYIFDHLRVLRTIPTCTFASMDVDWWSQVALIPLCGMVLACCIFKANRQGYGVLLEGNDIVKLCGVAFFGHGLLHLVLLVYVVPLFGKKSRAKP
jgi:hypothetical protein